MEVSWFSPETKFPNESDYRQRREIDPEDSSSLDQRCVDIASCGEIDAKKNHQYSNRMNIATPSPLPCITLEDCRDALKKYPNHDRLVLRQNQKTGKVSIVGSGSTRFAFHSVEETAENRVTLEAVKELIKECAQKYERSADTSFIHYHTALSERIKSGMSLDAELLRRALFVSTGTIHGAEGDYHYQAALADPTRGAIRDLPQGCVPRTDEEDLDKMAKAGINLATNLSKGAITSMKQAADALSSKLEKTDRFNAREEELFPLLGENQKSRFE